MTMSKFEPVAWICTTTGFIVTDRVAMLRWISQGYRMDGLHPADQLTEAYSAGKRDAIPLKETLVDLINEHVGDALFCERVWSAWQVGTMSEDDFTPVSECSNPSDLADAIISMLAAAPKGEE